MIFRYPGGKSKKSIRSKIMSRFPDLYSEFRDAMVGGGGIFFGVPRHIKRWINDIDPHLISVYSALKNNPTEFINQCRQISKEVPNEPKASAKSGKALYNARLKNKFDELAKGPDNALKYLFINRTVWAGRVNYDLESRMYFSNPSGWNIVHTDHMERAAKFLKNTKITCGSYEDVLFTEGKDVVIYIDPPYYVNTELDKGSRLYRFNFEKEDHDKLAKNIRQCKHKVVISYDNHPYIRDLYKDHFNLGETSWTYTGTSSVISDGQSFDKRIGKELIITNF